MVNTKKPGLLYNTLQKEKRIGFWVFITNKGAKRVFASGWVTYWDGPKTPTPLNGPKSPPPPRLAREREK